MEVITFNELPNAVSGLLNEIREVKALLIQKVNPKDEPETPSGIKEISDLIGLTVPTLYGYCQRNEIPHHKKGNRLYFFRSEIIKWAKEGKVKTIKELAIDADSYLSKK